MKDVKFFTAIVLVLLIVLLHIVVVGRWQRKIEIVVELAQSNRRAVDFSTDVHSGYFSIPTKRAIPAMLPDKKDDRPLDNLRKIIPQPLKSEVKVQIILPPEVSTVVRSLHQDRYYIAYGISLTLLLVFLFLCIYTIRTIHDIFWGD